MLFGIHWSELRDRHRRMQRILKRSLRERRYLLNALHQHVHMSMHYGLHGTNMPSLPRRLWVFLLRKSPKLLFIIYNKLKFFFAAIGDQSQCLNGGTCIATGTNTYTCRCLTGIFFLIFENARNSIRINIQKALLEDTVTQPSIHVNHTHVVSQAFFVKMASTNTHGKL
jgi:hypothetical protein